MTVFTAILAVVFIVIWLGVQKSMRDRGITPLSRGQMRYVRRKARKLGLSEHEVPFRPRRNADQHVYPREDIRLDAESLRKAAESSALQAAEWAAMERYKDIPVNPGTPSGLEDPEYLKKAAEEAREWAQMQLYKDIPVNPGTPSRPEEH